MIIQIYLAHYWKFDGLAIPIFSLSTIIWASALLRNWKLIEKDSAFRRGMIHLEEKEDARAEFENSAEALSPNLITGIDEPHQPTWKYSLFRAISFLGTATVMALVVVVTFSIYIFKSQIEASVVAIGNDYIAR